MAIGLTVGNSVWPVGTGDFFHAFFSTISARLEPAGWGTRFPVLLNELYGGELAGAHAAAALAELDVVRAELARLPPSAVVWDIADRAKRPPWGDDISEDITDLANYFVNENGNDLIHVLVHAIGCAERTGAPLRVG